MANRFNDPDIQFCDQNGLPYAGGSLSLFASGTSTPLAVYSDSSLLVPRGTVVTLDSAGRAGSIFLQNLQYKVVLADVNSVQIWTEDPVYSSDISTVAQFQSYNGNPNGHVAGTQGSSSQSASVVWDYADDVLYVCTTTGNAASAVWTAVNPSISASQSSLPEPGGYLTASSDPINYIPLTNALAQTQFYYTAIKSQLVPVYNGSNMVLQNMGGTQLTFALNGNYTAGNIYDIFAFMNNGTLTLGIGPTWTTVTPGSCARGTGGGTTQLTKIGGYLVNASAMTMSLSTTGTASCPANQGTYLGSIYIGGGTNGQFNCYRGYTGGTGANAASMWCLYNAYNQRPVGLIGGESTASWTYNSNTWRQLNSGAGANSNYIMAFTGLPDNQIGVKWFNKNSQSNNNELTSFGVNSTSTPYANAILPVNQSIPGMYITEGILPPALGLTQIFMIEISVSGTSNFTGGGASTCLMQVGYNA